MKVQHSLNLVLYNCLPIVVETEIMLKPRYAMRKKSLK